MNALRDAMSRSDNVTLGIRPEFIEVVSADDGGMPAKVSHLQDLGTYRIVTASLGSLTCKVRVDDALDPATSCIHLHFPERWLGLYVDERRVEVAS